MFIFSQMSKNGCSACKAKKGGDAVASLTGDNAAEGNAGKSFDEI